MQLTRLGRDQGLKIIKNIARNRISENMALHILNRTDGVPLFLEELTRTIIESGLKNNQNIPNTLQGSLLSRLDRLLSEARILVQFGSVIGREFGISLLTSVIGKSFEDISDSIKQLLRSNLVVKSVGESENETIIFRHALIRDAAYQTQLYSRRRKLNKKLQLR